MANMNQHDAKKHVLKDECEQMHMRTNNGVHLREMGCEGREGMQMTHIHKVSPPHHAYPLMTHVNSTMTRAISGSSDNDTVVPTPIAPLQPYQLSQHHPQSHWPLPLLFEL
jgi:hypothetical protein